MLFILYYLCALFIISHFLNTHTLPLSPIKKTPLPSLPRPSGSISRTARCISRSHREHITHRQVHITFASRTYHDGTAVHITPHSGISRSLEEHITSLQRHHSSPANKKQGLTEALSRTLPLPLLFFSLIDAYCECRQTAKISKITPLTTHQQTSWTFS